MILIVFSDLLINYYDSFNNIYSCYGLKCERGIVTWKMCNGAPSSVNGHNFQNFKKIKN